MAYQLERVNDVDDPNRCQGSTTVGQCIYRAMDGSTLCSRCAGGQQDKIAVASRNQYILTKPEYRLRMEQLDGSDRVKTLQDEVQLAIVLLEEHLNAVKNDGNQTVFLGVCDKMLQTISQLKCKNHILEQNVGQLYTRETILQLLNSFLQIVDDEVRSLPGGDEAVDKVRDRCFNKARQARNAEQTRGLKLLTQD